MIGFDLGVVVVAPRGAGGPLLDLDFVADRYRRAGESAETFAALSGTGFSRTGAGTAITTGGAIVLFAAGVARTTDGGLLLEPARTNKVTCHNANPTDLTNIAKYGDPAATLSVVDDSAALIAARLSAVCSAGKAFRLDNSGGSTNAIVAFSGPVGNINPHTISLYVRMSATGGVTGLLNGNNTGFVASGPGFGVLGGYSRIFGNLTPDTNARVMGLRIPAGAVAHFILMQLEEGASSSSPSPPQER